MQIARKSLADVNPYFDLRFCKYSSKNRYSKYVDEVTEAATGSVL